MGEIAVNDRGPSIFFGQGGFDLESHFGERGKGDRLVLEVSYFLSNEAVKATSGSETRVEADGKSQTDHGSWEPQQNLKQGFHDYSLLQI